MSQPAAPLVRVHAVSKGYQTGANALLALQSISFSVADGEFVCLLGPSGSGKSTLLRMLGGLLKPDSGTIQFQGEPLQQPHPAIGIVLQKMNLMPWRTVWQNVLLGVEVAQGSIGPADEQAAQQMIRLVGLTGFEQAYPSQLSGGMNQRVALARALLTQPRLLLMDEPFGALDALTRERLNLELLHLHAAQTSTIIMVTHNIAEAVLLADRVLVMSERPGRIVADIAIDLPRPRQIEQSTTPRFAELSMAVRRSIGEMAV